MTSKEEAESRVREFTDAYEKRFGDRLLIVAVYQDPDGHVFRLSRTDLEMLLPAKRTKSRTVRRIVRR
jgi:hypothetical protein